MLELATSMIDAQAIRSGEPALVISIGDRSLTRCDWDFRLFDLCRMD